MGKSLQDQLDDLKVQEQIDFLRNRNLGLALALLGDLGRSVDAMANDWHIAANNVAEAYYTAWKNYTDAIKADASIKSTGEVLGEMFAEAVLDAALGAALGWLAGKVSASISSALAEDLAGVEGAARQARFLALQQGLTQSETTQLAIQAKVASKPLTTLERDLLSLGLESATKAAVNEAQWTPPEWTEPIRKKIEAGKEGLKSKGTKVILDALKAPVDTTPVSADPVKFHYERANLVEQAHKQANAFIAQAYRAVHDAPAESWDDYDDNASRAVIQMWKTEANKLPATNDLPSVDTMAREFERRLWANWIPHLYHHGEANQFSDRPMVYDNIASGGKIAARLKELGILDEAGLGDIHWYGNERNEDEALGARPEKMGWAQKVVFKDFLTIRHQPQ